MAASKNVKASINFIAPMSVRPRYHANDASRDVLELDPQTIDIFDARAGGARLDREGFALVPHVSRVKDFHDPEEVQAVYRPEMLDLIRDLTGADAVSINSPGLLRFGEKSALSGKLNNSRPARFIHVDIDDETAARFSQQSNPETAKRFRRAAHYNIWRVISDPPQDVPLTLCDARTIDAADLVEADAVFDEPGKPEWSFTGLVARANPQQRWQWFPDMTRDEAIVFKTNDSDPDEPHCVPHSAFDNPLCPDDAPPRESIEMRAIAYWYD